MPTVKIDMVALAPGLKPFFTADNTQAFVEAQQSPTTASDCVMSLNGLGVHTRFQRGDSVLILAGGIRLPFVYSMATLPIVMNLNWRQDAGDPIVVPICQLLFPNEGVEVSFKGSNADGIFIRNAALDRPDENSDWYLEATLDITEPGTINQFYAPDVINGEDLEIDFWLKIQHTLDLESDA